MKILEELFLMEKPFFKSDLMKCEEYKKTLQKLADEEDNLIKNMDEGQISIFEKFCELQYDLIYLGRTQSFIDGFKLGAGIVYEVLDEQ